MTLYDAIKNRKRDVLACAAHYHIARVRVFGSAARKDEREDSDIDLLIAPGLGCSLLDVSSFRLDMEDMFDRKVDVVTEKGVYAPLKDVIFNEARDI
jgi:predicted nucleotidyltransferase